MTERLCEGAIPMLLKRTTKFRSGATYTRVWAAPRCSPEMTLRAAQNPCVTWNSRWENCDRLAHSMFEVGFKITYVSEPPQDQCGGAHDVWRHKCHRCPGYWFTPGEEVWPCS